MIGKTVGKAVFFQILAETQAVSLVHAKMYFLCADTLGEVFQHALDEGIGLLFLRKQVISVVLQTVVVGQRRKVLRCARVWMQGTRQMPKSSP